MNNEIKMVMGGYLDENDRLMDRTELNKRIKSIQEELETTRKLLEEAVLVIQFYGNRKHWYSYSFSEHDDCSDEINDTNCGHKAREFLAKLSKEGEA